MVIPLFAHLNVSVKKGVRHVFGHMHPLYMRPQMFSMAFHTKLTTNSGFIHSHH